MQNTGMQGSTPTSRESDNLSAQAGSALAHLSDSAQHTFERFTQAASQAASRLSERGEAFMHGRTAEQARTYMREHPWATIGIAVAVGLLLSRLISRR